MALFIQRTPVSIGRSNKENYRTFMTDDRESGTAADVVGGTRDAKGSGSNVDGDEGDKAATPAEMYDEFEFYHEYPLDPHTISSQCTADVQAFLKSL